MDVGSRAGECLGGLESGLARVGNDLDEAWLDA